MGGRTGLRGPAGRAMAGLAALGLLVVGGAGLGAGPAGAQELKEVKMGYLPLISWAPYFLAIEKGYYREQGLRVELIRFKTAAEMYGAVKTATMEVGTGSVAAGHFSSVAKGVRMKIVGDKGTLGPGCGYSYFIVRKDLARMITSPKDLKGRRVMLNAPAGAPLYLLAKLLERGGLTEKDVTLVYLSFPQMPVAFRNKAIDAAHIVDPQGVRAIEAGDAEPFLNSREVPVVNGANVGMMFYAEHFMAQRRDQAVGFMVAYVKGIRDYLKAPQGEEVVRVVSKYTQVPPEIVAKSQKMCIDPSGLVLVENIMEQHDFWYARGAFERRLTAEELITQSFAEAAERRLR